MPTPRDGATYEGITVLADLPEVTDSAGATAWQASVEPPPGMGVDDTTYGSAATLLADLAEQMAMNGGLSRIAFMGAPGPAAARAVIQSSGALDDSVLGVAYDLELSRGPNGWYVSGARMRTHCRRGVSADGFDCI